MKPKTNSRSDAHDLPKKVFDVSRPGKTLAETTSRSVIVGHKPQVQDPMMMHPDEQRSLLDAKRKVTVAPSAPDVPEPEQSPVDTSPEPQPTAADVILAPNATLSPISPASAPLVPDARTPEEQKESTQPVDEFTAQPQVPEPTETTSALAAPKPSNSAAEEPQTTPPVEPKPMTTPTPAEDSVAAILSEGVQEAETSTAPVSSQEPLPDISDAHVYPPTTMIVSHHDKKARMGKLLLWTLIVVVLVAIIADILLDAGFFVLNVPHTDFF